MRFTLTRRPLLSPGDAGMPERIRLHRSRVLGASAALILLTGGCGSTNMSDAAMQDMESSGPSGDTHSHSHGSEGDGTADSLQGFTLDALETTATTEYGGKVTFRIMQENGVPLTKFEPVLAKTMHLYLVSEDLSTYHHLHPTKDMGGTWTAEVPELPPGRLHVVTDFVALDESEGTHPLVLGSDLTIDGTPESVALPKPATTVKVDGYSASLDDGGLVAGQEAKLNLTVTEKGKPVALKPYLYSWAHTSAFAADTLAYAHLHPTQEWAEGAPTPEELTFVWTPAAAGTYRLFVQFQTESGLHLAEFTRTVTG